MQFIAIKTRVMMPPRDDLFTALDEALSEMRERDILVVTSKVLAIHQGRCVPERSVGKEELVLREADALLPKELRPNRRALMTIKAHTVVASAGVDESNGNGHYILWPERISESAKEIWQHLRAMYRVRECGVVVADSHSVPLRSGALGTAIGFWGFEPINRHRGKPDIFGRRIRGQRSNIPDALAATGVLAMGEVAEQTPLCLVHDIPQVVFTDKDTQNDFFISRENDYFAPFFKDFKTL